jgi:hypothetical protein
MRRSPGFFAIGVAVLAAGCAEGASPDRLIAPSEKAQHGAQPHLVTPVVFDTFLRPVRDPETGIAYEGGGMLRLTFGWDVPTAVEQQIVPPGPCRTTSLLPAVQEGAVQVHVCAFIANPGGGVLVGGGLALNNDPNQRGGIIVPFGTPNLYPPGPCRSYVVEGALAVDANLPAALSDHPGDIAALFEFQEVNERPGGEIRGTFGPPSSGPGDPGAIAGFQEVTEVDPSCVIDVTMATRS